MHNDLARILTNWYGLKQISKRSYSLVEISTSVHGATQIRFVRNSFLLQSECSNRKTHQTGAYDCFRGKTGVVHMPTGRVVHIVFHGKTAHNDCALGRTKPHAPPPSTQGAKRGGTYGFCIAWIYEMWNRRLL